MTRPSPAALAALLASSLAACARPSTPGLLNRAPTASSTRASSLPAREPAVFPPDCRFSPGGAAALPVTPGCIRRRLGRADGAEPRQSPGLRRSQFRGGAGRGGPQLWHGSTAMAEKVYSQLGMRHHRSEVVEYQVEQHAATLGDGPNALAGENL